VEAKQSIAIIGGGILGLAIGYKLSRKGIKVHLFEKEDALGKHQSGNNSGVLHCGLYYQPGSLKAKLAVEGIKEMVEFCRVNQIEYDLCGKIVVASDDRETGFLEDLAKRGHANGLTGLKFLNNAELKEREPNVKAQKSLLVPEEGIVSYGAVMQKLASFILENNGTISNNARVNNIKDYNGKKAILSTAIGDFEFDQVINCSGLFSDRTFEKLTNTKRPLRIVPFRGEYMDIKKDYIHLVNHLIYPVPNPQYPFLGVHFTRMIGGGREVGPNAVLALKREGYKNSDISVSDLMDTLSYKGFHKFLFKNFNFALGEFRSSLSAEAFVKKAKKLVPDVEGYMFDKGTAGVRAQAMDAGGNLIMDFKVEKFQNQIHVLNAPSPGATASLSIADYIIDNYVNL
jgi:L-2-hydroxyglutarate oxidase